MIEIYYSIFNAKYNKSSMNTFFLMKIINIFKQTSEKLLRQIFKVLCTIKEKNLKFEKW